jgi:acetylornithine deacetylase/succinyl-diaminopimelate desuccinylase-like protein
MTLLGRASDLRKPFLVFGLILVLGQSIRAAEDVVTAAARKNFGEYLELLAIPNIPDKPEDMRRNAAFLEKAFQKRGFSTQLLDNPAGRPLVMAQSGASAPGAKTLLFYIHFDGQPVIPEQWAQKSPFQPVVKKRDANGQWREVDRQQLMAEPLDPELRVFARSASDDKAPIEMFLTAIDVLAAQGRKPSVRVKVILDSEEEISSPSLAGVIAAHRPLFDADALVILDGPLHASGRPTVVFGNRGLTQATLTVYGPKSPAHSGHYGNYVPNPAMRLAILLASMKGEDGRVKIAGYYDGVNLTPADRAVLAKTGDDEAALVKKLGIAKPDQVGGNLQEALQYPSLNVRGMAAAGVGAKAANIIPSEAVAELDLRTTPETDGRRLFELIRRHVEAQGYHLVDAAPTDADRARYDRLATLKLGPVQAAERVPMDSPVGRWAVTALSGHSSADAAPPELVRIRMMGGTVPTDVLVDALHLPFVLVPTVNPDNNQHSHDENLRLGNFISGTRTIGSLLTTPYGA